MAQCDRHPEKDGIYFCQKDNEYMCDTCVQCYNQTIYCPYRTACVINLMIKEGLIEKSCPGNAGTGPEAHPK